MPTKPSSNPDADRVLVAFGSKHGATAEIAEAIGETIRSAGLVVEVLPAGRVQDITPYRAVVLGSAVYMLHWRRPAVDLLKTHRRELSDRPLWIFSSGPLKDDHSDQTPRKIRKLAARVGARECVTFGGRLPLSPSNFMERSMLKNTPPEKRDARDWGAIRDWADSITETLHGSSEMSEAAAAHPLT